MKKLLLLCLLCSTLLLLGLWSCKSVSRTQYAIDKSACNGCTNCSTVCPSDAIYFNSQGKAVIDQSKCTTCGDCVAVCPQNAIY